MKAVGEKILYFYTTHRIKNVGNILHESWTKNFQIKEKKMYRCRRGL